MSKEKLNYMSETRFIEVPFETLQFNPQKLIGQDWMLLSAGDADAWNTMTISWGSLGSLWHLPNHPGTGGMPTATVYVRPQRFTKKFIDHSEFFTLSVLGEQYRKDMSYLGSHSGKNEDKISQTSLHPVFDQGTVYLQEADIVLICRKLYHGKLRQEGFVDTDLLPENYPLKDFHDIYIGEIVHTLVCKGNSQN